MAASRSRFLIPLIVFIVMAIFLGIGLKLDPRHVPSPLIDKASPDFSLPQLHAKNKTLAKSDFLGKVSLFNVWASWCAACRQEHPFLMELSRAKLVPIYGLNYKDTRSDAQQWLNQYGGDPYLASAFDADGRVGIDWGVYGVPETFVIDKKGVIRYKHIGPLDAGVWTQTLAPIVQQLQAEQL